MSEIEAGPGNRAFSESAAQILATEHWSLLAARAMVWNEAFARVTIFLTILSASIVALALVVNTSGFGDAFTWFAYGLAPLVLFIGICTYVRLVQINLEDFMHVIAMNRLRHGYVDMAPEVKDYLMAGWHDDARGALKTMILARSKTASSVAHLFVTTPTMVAIVNASVAGATAALVAHRIGAGREIVILTALVSFLIIAIWLLRAQFGVESEIARLRPRFPSTQQDYRDELGPTHLGP